MSIHCTKQVWDHATRGGPALLLLLALADYADQDGFAFPGQRALAAKVRLSVRHTRRLLATLQANGDLLILDRPGRCSVYVVLAGTGRQSLAAALDRARSFGAGVPACTLPDALGRLSDRHPQPPAAGPAPSAARVDPPDSLPPTPDNLSPTPDTAMSPPAPDNLSPTPDTAMSPALDNLSPTPDTAMSPAPDTATSPDPSLSVIDPSLEGKWEKTLALLQLQMTKATFDQNLRGSRVVAVDGERLTVQLRNRYALGWVQNRLAGVVARALPIYLPGMTAHFVPPPLGPPQPP